MNTSKKTKAVLAGLAASALTVGATSFAFGSFSPTGGAGGSGGTAGDDQGYENGYEQGYSAGSIDSGAVVGSGTNAVFTRFKIGANTASKPSAKNKGNNHGANGGKGGGGGNATNHF
jgi:hypothetical protein